MRQFLTYLLPLHWMAVFAVLAAAAAEGPGGAGFGLSMLGMAGGAELGPHLSTAFALGFGLVSALFLWLLLTAFFGADTFPGAYEDVASSAFGCATALVTALFLALAMHPGEGLLAGVSILICALAASYVAVHAERRSCAAVEVDAGEDVRAAARLMAVGAAHASMLTRLTGRPSHPDEGR